MSSSDRPSPFQHGEHAGDFRTTHWTMVVSARDSQSTEAQAALERLCRAYWMPLYAFVRRKGYGPHDAQDLTQGFFERFLSKHYLKSVDRSKGRFRSFLAASISHYLSDELDRKRAQKRGGDRTILSLDYEDAERRYTIEPADLHTPEKLFERHWVLTLLDQVLERLRAEYERSGKGPVFEGLKVFITGDQDSISYAELARDMNTSEPAVRMSVSRMRKRYRQLLHASIADTVASSEEIEDELRYLFTVLGG